PYHVDTDRSRGANSAIFESSEHSDGHLHSTTCLASQISSRGRRHTRSTLAWSDEPRTRTGRYPATATDDLHQHHARLAHAEFVSAADRQRLRADSLSGSHSGIPR